MVNKGERQLIIFFSAAREKLPGGREKLVPGDAPSEILSARRMSSSRMTSTGNVVLVV